MITPTYYLISNTVGPFAALDVAESTFWALTGTNHKHFEIVDRRVIGCSLDDGRRMWAVTIEWQTS